MRSNKRVQNDSIVKEPKVEKKLLLISKNVERAEKKFKESEIEDQSQIVEKLVTVN